MQGRTAALRIVGRGRTGKTGSYLAAVAVVLAACLVGVSSAGATVTTLDGAGSSFAAPVIESFQKQVQPAPYDLSITYTSTSSGDGRSEFANGTADFGVTDIPYGLGDADTTPPSFPFIYVPITAAGISFMYNIPGLTKTLQLDSSTTCSILTGAITSWNDPTIAQLNPGVTLPDLPIRPVTEDDPAGTNYALEDWCIVEQPTLWATFADAVNAQPTNQVAISPTEPEPQWPLLANGLDAGNTTAVANDVTTTPGAVGAVELQYATDEGFGMGDPAKGVASVRNASGAFTQPTPVDVTSALAYATQLSNGTVQLDFNGIGPHVYNPSTVSYLLSPAANWTASRGAVMSAFINYALTVGERHLPSGYGSLGLSLEQAGVGEVARDVPGAIPLSPEEQALLACGDLTPPEVAAGDTTPVCDVPPLITSGAAAEATVGLPFSFTVGASGTPTPTVAESGALPAGITFSGGSGTPTLSGTPLPGTAGTYPVSFTAFNGVSPAASQTFVLTVVPIRVTTGDLPVATAGTAYSTTLTAAGGQPPYRWRVVIGALPRGFHLDRSTGTISGITKQIGSLDLVVAVRDSRSLTPPRVRSQVTTALSLTVDPP